MRQPPQPLLHEVQAARILGMSPAWLRRKRWEGEGPCYVKHGRAVRYEIEALEEWIAAHRTQPTGASLAQPVTQSGARQAPRLRDRK